MVNIERWDIQVFGVDPKTRAGLGELRFSVIDHGRSATVYVDVPSVSQLRGAVGGYERVALLAGWIGRDRREPDKVLMYAVELANLATAHGGQ